MGDPAVEDIIQISALSPRLIRLLELFLRSPEPVKVDAVSQALNVSRRTVFRELENLSPVLSAAGCALVSVPGKGIVLSGDRETHQTILDNLSLYTPRPASKRERLLRLMIELVTNAGEMQKLLHYANALNVSESTISHDLDELEPWLSDQGLSLSRKSGAGVLCEGSENNLRTALVNRFMLDGDTEGRSFTAVFDYPGDDIESGVREILRRKTNVVDWMTSEALCLIAVYLMVTVERVYEGKIITTEQTQAEGGGAFQKALAGEIAAEIAKTFSIELAAAELLALAGWIQSCRSKNESPLDSGQADQQALTQNLTLKMIDCFDPPVAAILKTNEQLTRLLSRHLESALPRLKSGKFLPNPMEKQLVHNYPEVYEKTLAAVKPLEEYLDIPVPSNEVSFIQIHFLAAQVLLGDHNVKRRILRAGIVCVSGIGTSYMLAYQIRKRFKGELETEVADSNNRSSFAAFDFLISTIPLDETEKPFVRVQTILQEKDFQKIQEAINAFAFTEKKTEQAEHSPSLAKRLNSMIDIFIQSRKLLDNFSVESIKGNCSFDELVRFGAARFAPENPGAVCQALLEREAVNTQVVCELGIVLLHTRSACVRAPVFALIVPEGGMFSDGYFKQTQSCVFMLLPENTHREITDLMGGISGALIDMPPFLEAVRSGNRETVRAILEQEITQILDRHGGENA
jgi:mannitol operon transcriptional antiterminator